METARLRELQVLRSSARPAPNQKTHRAVGFRVELNDVRLLREFHRHGLGLLLALARREGHLNRRLELPGLLLRELERHGFTTLRGFRCLVEPLPGGGELPGGGDGYRNRQVTTLERM